LDTLGAILKYQDDLQGFTGTVTARIIGNVKAVIATSWINVESSCCVREACYPIAIKFC
jgi:hypothetical protein